MILSSSEANATINTTCRIPQKHFHCPSIPGQHTGREAITFLSNLLIGLSYSRVVQRDLANTICSMTLTAVPLRYFSQITEFHVSLINTQTVIFIINYHLFSLNIHHFDFIRRLGKLLNDCLYILFKASGYFS